MTPASFRPRSACTYINEWYWQCQPAAPLGAPPPAVTVYIRQTYNLPPDVTCAAVDTDAFTRRTQALLQNGGQRGLPGGGGAWPDSLAPTGHRTLRG